MDIISVMLVKLLCVECGGTRPVLLIGDGDLVVNKKQFLSSGALFFHFSFILPFVFSFFLSVH